MVWNTVNMLHTDDDDDNDNNNNYCLLFRRTHISTNSTLNMPDITVKFLTVAIFQPFIYKQKITHNLLVSLHSMSITNAIFLIPVCYYSSI
jgi:hypothetical protein